MILRRRICPAMERAKSFLATYAGAGFLLLILISAIAGSSLGGLGGIFVGAHLLSAILLWPSATIVSLLLRRWIGPPRGRVVWISGVIAVPVVWIGTLLGARLSEDLFIEVQAAVGRQVGLVVTFGWAVLFSNLILLIAWLVPLGRRHRLP
jgi:hypothetical protein